MRTKNIQSRTTEIFKGILLLIITISFGSCDREMNEEIISVTPPELHVVVYLGEDESVRIAGSEVKLFSTEEDRADDKNEISSTVTDDNGVAIFMESDFQKGILFISATNGTVTGETATPYLLQNDGKTYVWVSAR